MLEVLGGETGWKEETQIEYMEEEEKEEEEVWEKEEMGTKEKGGYMAGVIRKRKR